MKLLSVAFERRDTFSTCAISPSGRQVLTCCGLHSRLCKPSGVLQQHFVKSRRHCTRALQYQIQICSHREQVLVQMPPLLLRDRAEELRPVSFLLFCTSLWPVFCEVGLFGTSVEQDQAERLQIWPSAFEAAA